jgi:hypothetical protein
MSRGERAFAFRRSLSSRTLTPALVVTLASSSAINVAHARAEAPRHAGVNSRGHAGRCGSPAADYLPLLPLRRLARRTGDPARRCIAGAPGRTVAAVPLLADSELLYRRASFRVVAVTLRRRSRDLVRLVEPGSKLRHCGREKVVSIGAYDIVAGAELDQGYATVWRLNGRVKAVTHFRWPTGKPFGGYVLDRGAAAIEDGHWHVALRSNGETIGATDVALRGGGRC